MLSPGCANRIALDEYLKLARGDAANFGALTRARARPRFSVWLQLRHVVMCRVGTNLGIPA